MVVARKIVALTVKINHIKALIKTLQGACSAFNLTCIDTDGYRTQNNFLE